MVRNSHRDYSSYGPEVQHVPSWSIEGGGSGLEGLGLKTHECPPCSPSVIIT